MHSFTKTLAFTTLAFSITSCWSSDSVDSNKVSSDTYHIDYAVDYDAVTNRSSAQAQFRVGGPTGTTVRLAKPSEISVNGQVMNLKDGDKASFNVLGSYYLLERLPKRDTYEFSFIDNNSHARKDTAQIPDPVSVVEPEENERLNLNDDVIVKLDAPNLQDSERLEVTLTGKEISDGKRVSARVSASIRNSEEAVFKAQDLSRFLIDEPVIVSARRVRMEKVVDHHSSQTAFIATSYQGKPVTIRVAR